MLFKRPRPSSGRWLPQEESAASQGAQSLPNLCGRPHPPPGPASRPAWGGEGTPGHPRFPLRLQNEHTPARRSGVSSGAWDSVAQLRAARRGSGLPNGESRMRARTLRGRRPRGEGRVQSPTGRGAPGPRRMRREGAQSRTRPAATGWREETPAGESAKEIWPPARARAPGECAPQGGPRLDARRTAGLGGACVLPEPVEEGKTGRGRSAAVAANLEGWVGGAHWPP